MSAVSVCIARRVLSYSLCYAPVLSIGLLTHGTDPTSSTQPPLCPHAASALIWQWGCLLPSILLNLRLHHYEYHLYYSLFIIEEKNKCKSKIYQSRSIHGFVCNLQLVAKVNSSARNIWTKVYTEKQILFWQHTSITHDHSYLLVYEHRTPENLVHALFDQGFLPPLIAARNCDGVILFTFLYFPPFIVHVSCFYPMGEIQ